MDIVKFLFIYFLTYSVTIFAVLPFHSGPTKKIEKGYSRSAPKNPKIAIKLIINAFVALILSLVFYYGIEYLLNFLALDTVS